MERLDADFVILGSGFAGSLAAMILKRLDFRPVVVDRATHPRFAIGESSTPVANFVLRDLVEKYDLTRLAPLAKYGPWQKYYPQIGCGLKRGFSYFEQQPGRRFEPRPDHANELLVAASADDEHSDTQWLRADVDSFLASEVRRMEIPLLEQTEIVQLVRDGDGWLVSGRRGDGQSVEIAAKFVIDGTGEGMVVPKALGIPARTDLLHTNSRALFSHFRGVGAWRDWLRDAGGAIDEHPFGCDDAAQHMILDGAWMWVLRFNGGLTSVGIAIDDVRRPLDRTRSPEQEWDEWMKRHPAVAELLRKTTIADPPGRLIRTGRLQRRFAQAAGKNWALLPHTAGFIDPLHSSGIAHSLCGVERLTHTIECHWGRDSLAGKLADYERSVLSEVELIDRLVSGCYAAIGNFRLLVAYAMTYFAAATTYERRRSEHGFEPKLSYLCANDPDFTQTIAALHRDVLELTGWPTERTVAPPDIAAFEQRISQALAPYNHVGLCDWTARNLYRYTVAPE